MTGFAGGVLATLLVVWLLNRRGWHGDKDSGTISEATRREWLRDRRI